MAVDVPEAFERPRLRGEGRGRSELSRGVVPFILPPRRERGLRVIASIEAQPIEHAFPTRIHGFASVVLMMRGTGSLAAGGVHATFTPGTLLVIPPGHLTYRVMAERRVVFVPLLLAPDEVPSFIGCRYMLSAPDAARIARELAAGPDATQLRGIIQAAERFASASRNFGSSAEHRLASSILVELGQRSDRPSLGSIARSRGYTPDGLSALLRRETGRSFLAWRDEIAMVGVRRDLSMRERPITEIAASHAFEPAYFSRRFRLIHGTSPRAWRAAPLRGTYGAYSFDEWLPNEPAVPSSDAAASA